MQFLKTNPVNYLQQPDACLGVVLAGGASSRMGEDKASLMRNQQSMLTFAQSLLKQAGVTDIVISGDKHQVPDLFEQAGPMAGIYSVIQQYRPRAILALPVDLPLMDSETLKALVTAGQLNNKATYYQGHYLPLYLPVNGFVEQFFASAFADFSGKGPSIRALLKAQPFQELAVTKEKALFNTNTPQEWRQAKATFSL